MLHEYKNLGLRGSVGIMDTRFPGSQALDVYEPTSLVHHCFNTVNKIRDTWPTIRLTAFWNCNPSGDRETCTMLCIHFTPKISVEATFRVLRARHNKYKRDPLDMAFN
jgi:hypothetical protein